MKTILVVGAGKIGRTIVEMLSTMAGYRVRVADTSLQALNAFDPEWIDTIHLNGNPDNIKVAMIGCDAVISALYHVHNPQIAHLAMERGLHYFDLTEDVESTSKIFDMAYRRMPNTIVMPQCGLAPGFVSIVAQSFMDELDEVDGIYLRVGALPQHPCNALKYNLTWSTEGLVNEYCNPCDAVVGEEAVKVQPLDGLETLGVDGVEYEAFNTSGGLGTLVDSYKGEVNHLNYKTLRYPGHRDLMKFLLHDMGYRYNRSSLVKLLDERLQGTTKDVVVIFCSATGRKDGRLVCLSDVRKIYSSNQWTAIQITTAASVCAVVDLMLDSQAENPGRTFGPCRQEHYIKLADFLANRFGRYYV